MDIDNDHRIAVVKAWRLASANGETQASFCSRQAPPIKPRTLRLWLKTVGAAEPAPLGSDIDLICAALENMRQLTDLLERNRLGGMPRGSDATAQPPAPESTSGATTEPGAAPERHGGIDAAGAAVDDVQVAGEPVVEASITICAAPIAAAAAKEIGAERSARAAAFWGE